MNKPLCGDGESRQGIQTSFNSFDSTSSDCSEDDDCSQCMDESEEDGHDEELPPLLVETLLSAPRLRGYNAHNAERLREKMAVDTLMLEWGWSREVAQAMHRRQGQLQDMRDSGVSLAEYSRITEQRRLSGHKHGMSSKSFGSGNHTKKRATGATTNSSSSSKQQQHPCALQMPPSIQFVF
jgi:hypothetical protein